MQGPLGNQTYANIRVLLDGLVQIPVESLSMVHRLWYTGIKVTLELNSNLRLVYSPKTEQLLKQKNIRIKFLLLKFVIDRSSDLPC